MKEVRFGKDGASTQRYGTYVGIVKSNEDPQHMGRCSVWIPEFGGDPAKETNWYVVSYASPFAGSSSVESNRKDAATAEGTQSSYGFWMQAPDLENQVLVTFANGDVSHGYWFACVYQQNMNHSVPGLPSNVSTDESLNGQGILPPVVEYNKKSKENPDNPHRPVFAPLHDGLSNQGLYPDAERGRSSSGSRRETPSKTFGYSTPRGTAMVIDDNPENEFIRLRTRGGAQVLVHETSGYVYINSRDGNSWVEISDEGVDIYSKKSVNVHAEEDLNFRAGRDVMIEGTRGVFVRAGQAITVESGQNTHFKAGTDFKIGAGGVVQAKAGGELNLDAAGNLTLKAGGNMLRTASQLHDNGPSAASVSTPEVKAVGDRTIVQSNISSGQATSAATGIAATAKTGGIAGGKLASVASKASGVTAKVASATTGATAATAASITKDASKVADRAKAAVAQVNTVKDKVQGIATKLTTTINSAATQARGAVGQATKALGDVTKTINQQAVAKIGGTAGGQLTGKVTSILNGVTNQATGQIGSLVGQANSMITKATGTATSAIALGTSLTAGALGKINTVRAELANTMTDVQAAGKQLSAVASNATNVAAQITSLAEAPDITTEAKAELTAVASQMTSTAAEVSQAGEQLSKQAVATQAMAAKQTTVKTITNRIPSHEPWPTHVKEGQKSPAAAKSPEEEKADNIAAAATRGGQSVANGEVPKIAKVTETVTTGTGKLIREVKEKAGPLLKIGSALVRSDIITAAKEAASISGVNVGYLMAKSSEMGFNPASTLAGAAGLMQMSKSVFTTLAGTHGAQLGIGVNDIADPRANLLMGSIMTKQNSDYLADRGVATGATELNLAHLMGAPVASQFLTNLERNPAAAARENVPEDFSRSHRSIFFASDGRARTMQEVYSTFSSKIEGKVATYAADVKGLEVAPIISDFPPGFFS